MIYPTSQDGSLNYTKIPCRHIADGGHFYFTQKGVGLFCSRGASAFASRGQSAPAFPIDWGGESLDHFEDCYCGEWEDEEDYARHIVDECYDLDHIMSNLAIYFDYAAYGRELFMYDYYMDNGHVFRHY